MAAKTCIKTLVWLLIVLMAAPPGLFAQNGAAPPLFRQEELDQMLAPIALYPDSLLVQVLMAATYPVEVVQANRWAKTNRNLTGEQFAAALDQQDWDPSVKSLVNFPSILTMMDENLGSTQRLGDAFLSQKDQVMDTVQRLRATAQTRGTLQNTSQQRIVTEGQTIVIESADPQVIYVPAYDPFYVYGPWWYPSYPPYRYYPRGAVLAGPVISFGLGIAVGLAWGYAWGGFGWHRHEVIVNVQRNVHVNTYINRTVYVNRIGGGRGEWRHDPVHRKGVAYRNDNMAKQFGQTPRGNPEARREFRGYTPSDSKQLSQPGVTPRLTGPRGQPGPGQQGVQERRDVRPPDRPGVQVVPHPTPPVVQERRDVRPSDRPGVQAPRDIPSRDRQQVQQATPSGAFTGIDRRGREVKINSDRGRASRESAGTVPAGPAITRPAGGKGNPSGGGAPKGSDAGRPGSEVSTPSGGNAPRGGDTGRPSGGGGPPTGSGSQRGGRH